MCELCEHGSLDIHWSNTQVVQMYQPTLCIREVTCIPICDLGITPQTMVVTYY